MVTTTITDVGIATWSLSGDAGVTEGDAASYTVHLAGTLQAGETATVIWRSPMTAPPAPTMRVYGGGVRRSARAPI